MRTLRTALRPLAALGALVAAAAAASAVQPAVQTVEEGLERVPLRVLEARPGAEVLCDRGSRDGVEVGDFVLFHPREGGTWGGNVVRVDERSSLVELHEGGRVPPPGTRGEVLVPRARRAPPAPPPDAGAADGETAGGTAGDAEPSWSNRDEEWSEDMPLLAELRAVRPAQREPRHGGRVYYLGDQTWTTENGRSDSFHRLGTDLWFENPFRRGGGLNVDLELNQRDTELPDDQGSEHTRLRLDRLSYHRGGTRFDATRWEAGRFLQRGMPEFGVLDGWEWSRRRGNGDRYGVSVGFLPEPDDEQETGDDFQLAAHYHRRLDGRGFGFLDAGFQKTFHHGDADRDLLVTKLGWLPPDGWRLHAAAWVDLYTEGDDEKPFVELTQALASATRRWEGGDELRVRFSHLRFPQLDRDEFLPVEDDQLDDDFSERLRLDTWRRLDRHHRLHWGVGGWVDEEEAGGDGEVGIEVLDLFAEGARAEASVFGSLGEFSRVAGLRLSYGRSGPRGRWDVLYELGLHENDGFSADFDDVEQHRLRVAADLFGFEGWTLGVHGEGLLWDDEGALSAGAHLQRSF